MGWCWRCLFVETGWAWSICWPPPHSPRHSLIQWETSKTLTLSLPSTRWNKHIYVIGPFPHLLFEHGDVVQLEQDLKTFYIYPYPVFTFRSLRSFVTETDIYTIHIHIYIMAIICSAFHILHSICCIRWMDVDLFVVVIYFGVVAFDYLYMIHIAYIYFTFIVDTTLSFRRVGRSFVSFVHLGILYGPCCCCPRYSFAGIWYTFEFIPSSLYTPCCLRTGNFTDPRYLFYTHTSFFYTHTHVPHITHAWMDE